MTDRPVPNVVPFGARKVMVDALFREFVDHPSEYTTWSDAIGLVEIAAHALAAAGWHVENELIDGSGDA